MVRAKSPALLSEPARARRKSTGVVPPRETSRGLRPAASGPSITQTVVEVLDGSPGDEPKPPSLFCWEASQPAAADVPARAVAGSVVASTRARSIALAIAGA